jgi:transcriptional regulator with XRE-family HTH domain
MVDMRGARLDVPRLLREARERSGMSQGELADRARTGASAVSAYERGLRAPNVRTFERLLAAAGWQLRVVLEPLLADVDARVDDMVRGAHGLDEARLCRFAASLGEELVWDDDLGAEVTGDDPAEGRAVPGEPGQRSGHVQWAVDGAGALALQRLAVPGDELELRMVLDVAARAWLARTWALGLASGQGAWWSVDLAEAQHAARSGIRNRLGAFRVRFVEQLPDTLQVLVTPPEDQAQVVVQVVPVDEVERSFPEHAETLARWRERRGTG